MSTSEISRESVRHKDGRVFELVVLSLFGAYAIGLLDEKGRVRFRQEISFELEQDIQALGGYSILEEMKKFIRGLVNNIK